MRRNDSNRKGGALLYVVVCISLIGLVYSGYRAYGIISENQEGDTLYQSIRQVLSRSETQPSGASVAAVLSTGENPVTLHTTTAATTTAPAISMDAEQPAEAAMAVDSAALDDTVASETDTATSQPIGREPTLTFDKLLAINKDTIGWITLDDSAIDYPVVRGADNEFYLHHLFDGEKGNAGTIFMNCHNMPDFTDQNTLLFGHHMRNGAMFAGIEKYRDQDYYEAHPSMALYTPNRDYTVLWFAGFQIQSGSVPIEFATESERAAYVEKALRKSDFSSTVTVAPEDRLLTLVTCAYSVEDSRYLLMGVLR